MYRFFYRDFNRLFELFFTALVIEYKILGQPSYVPILFNSQVECSQALNEGVADDLYDFLQDKYGKDISMTCVQSELVSKELVRPKARPDT